MNKPKYILPLEAEFRKHADPANAVQMKKYMKDRSEFFGIKSPPRRELYRKHISQFGLIPADQREEIVKWCWEAPQREWQYFAMEFLGRRKKKANIEKIEDFEHDGKLVHASRLGYRITEKFVHTFFGKVFDSPTIVFDEEMLRPETQGMAAYIDGINNIVEAQQNVALAYIEDGSIEDACPPLQAVLYIMAQGHYQGKTVDDPSIRKMFDREYLLQSDWYQQRLKIKQQRDAALWQMNRDYIEQKMDEINEELTDWMHQAYMEN